VQRAYQCDPEAIERWQRASSAVIAHSPFEMNASSNWWQPLRPQLPTAS
jgi:hypothetical protein